MYMTNQKCPKIGKTLFILLLCLSWVGCDDEPQEPTMKDPLMFGPGSGGQMSGGSMDPSGNEGGSMATESTFMSYTRLVAEETGTRGDLVVYDFQGDEEIWLNQGISVDEMDCVSKGCTLHSDLTWVGWLVQEGSQTPLWVAPINQSTRQIDLNNKRQVSPNALRFRFTENKIVYSEEKDPSSPTGIAVKIQSIDGSDNAQELDLISSLGGFSSTLADDLVILIKATLSSMSISFLKPSNGLSFDLFTFGEMGGTGSEFSASSNPVRLSPDNSYLVALTSNDFTWRVNTIQISDENPDHIAEDLFPSNSFAGESCNGNYPFNQILNEPIFNATGDSFYLLFGGDCSQQMTPTANRRDYDVYRFSRDITQPPVNMTRILRANHWSNHDLKAFTVSPDESKLAFVATRPNQNGTSSIWLVDLSDAQDGPPNYDCSRNTAQPGPDGHMRCEYLFYESDFSVNYRNLTYHQATF